MIRRLLLGVSATALFLAFLAAAAAAAPYEAKWESLDKRPCPQWYLDAKFGIFIHWGIVLGAGLGQGGRVCRVVLESHRTTRSRTTPGGSSTRRTTARTSSTRISPRCFAPSCSTPRSGPTSSPAPGPEYIVPTSKHHEGFCLWPSAEASRTWGRPWNAAEIGPNRDLMGELGGGHAEARAEVRLLLLALRVVQPALAQRPQALRRRAHPPAVQGRGDAATSRRSSSATANGTCPRRTGRARNCWPGCSTNRPARTRWWSTTAGARIAATSTAATGPRNTPPA